MVRLNLPPAQLRLRKEANKPQVFDLLRKKFVALTPEEWVRQHFIHYLVFHKSYPLGLIAVEAPVIVNGLKQRADVVIYNRKGKPIMIIECKATTIKIDNAVFDQAARYNMPLMVNYLVVTNGLEHYCAQINNIEASYLLLKEIPVFNEVDN